jgi:hypothetical protein
MTFTKSYLWAGRRVVTQQALDILFYEE